MRKPLAAAVAAVLLAALVPLVASATQAAPAPALRVAPDLAALLASADGTDEVVVFASGTSLGAIRSAVRESGLTEVDAFERIDVVVAHGSVAGVRRLSGSPSVRYLEMDGAIEFHLDTSHQATRGEEVIAGFASGDDVVPALTGAGVSIAIIDSGVDGTHPFFEREDGSSQVVRNLKFLCPFFYACDSTPPAARTNGDTNDALWVDAPGNDSDTGSMGGHGTHVAGIAGGRAGLIDGEIPITGAAPGASLIGLSIGQTASVYAGFAAMNWVLEHHADPCGTGDGVACPPIKVINNSWGPGDGASHPYEASSVENQLQAALVAEGVTVVWAAGNDGGDGTEEDYVNPDSKSPLPGVLSVANYDDGDTGTRDGMLDSSSSRGKQGDPTTYPDLSAPGATITSSCRRTLPICYLHGDTGDSAGDYFNLGGTSMAAPHVAGIVAQLLGADPTLTPGQIEELLEDTAYKFSFGGPYEPDPRNAGGDTTSFDKGHGLVDVKAAVALLLGVDGVPREEAPPGLAPCAPEGPVVTDPAGDATQVVVLVGPGPNEAALDVRQLDLAWDETANELSFVATVTDLGETNPTTSPHASWNVTFDYEGTGYYVEAIRSASGEESYGYGRSATISVPTPVGATGATTRTPDGAGAGALDPAADTITMRITSAALEEMGAPPLEAGAVLTNFSLVSRRTVTDRVMGQGSSADQTEGGCEYTLGTGTTSPPAPEPVPEPEPEPEAGDHWFLHYTGPCDGGEEDVVFMDGVDSAGDSDGCGAVGAGGLAGLDVETWPATEPLAVPLPAGSIVRGTVYLQSLEPAPVIMTATLADSAGSAGSGFAEFDVSAGAVDVIAGAWVPMTFEMVTEREIPAGEALAFSVALQTQVSWFFGYEGDHASAFSIAPPAAPGPAPAVYATVNEDTGVNLVGTTPTDNVDHECSGPNDPRCVTFLIDVQTDTGYGLLQLQMNGSLAHMSAGHDFDVLVYSHGDGGALAVSTQGPSTTPAETAFAYVAAGLYYVVVQPFAAPSSVDFGVVGNVVPMA